MRWLFFAPASASGAPRTSGRRRRFVDFSDPASLAKDGFRGEQFDAVVSCMASRTGAPKDAWAIDHQAHVNLLDAAREAGVGQFVQLSAICVQKPLLAFQHAKLAFETALIESGVTYSIVRPTAFFKSLSGQIERVRSGKPFLIFGDGALTACKPISDDDLGAYLAECLEDEIALEPRAAHWRPGAAITPRQQGEFLFSLLGRPPKFQKGSGRADGRHHRRARPARAAVVATRGKGGVCANRPLLRHRIDAVAEPRDRPL